MAFRTFLYLDEDKVRDYQSAIDGTTKRGAAKKTFRGKLDLGIGEVEAGLESGQSNSPTLSPAAAYDLLENSLEKRLDSDYFNLLDSDCDMATLPPLSLLRCTGYIEIPESFDTLALISKYIQPLRNAGLIDLEGDPRTNEFALSFFEETKADIPVLITGNEITVSSKLKTECFVDGTYQSLEDLEDEEVFILCKIHSLSKGENVVIFDPARDFLRLNRAARRSMKSTTGLEKITEPSPVLKTEMVAIYH